ncbi:MAG: LacI family DNA-binding transcriptional regulator [Verrucomicrobia bacterium]|nr:LacI family DNA-binding transcriptional regulator [Verrucomicrobiota bacterium]
MPKRQQAVNNVRPTIRDVARAAGVSTATVSNVLRGTRFVGPARQKKVRDAIELLGYNPNWLAAGLRARRSGVIGLVVPDITISFFSGILSRIEELAAGSNYQIILADAQEKPERERERVRALLRRQPDGLILVPCSDYSAALQDIRQHKVPAVLVDRGGEVSGFDSIDVNNFDATREGAGHLLRLGHRQILAVATNPALRNIAQRIAGFKAALKAGRGRGQIINCSDPVEARQKVLRVLRERDRPTAIFAFTEQMALGSLRAIWESGIEFPGGISLIAFDDCEWMTALRPFVSTLRQPTNAIAEKAWLTLLKRLQGNQRIRSRQQLECTLMIRESTTRPGRVASQLAESAARRQTADPSG